MRVIASIFLIAGLSFAQQQSTDINLDVNHSTVIQIAGGMKRISVASGEIAEAVAVSPNELVVNAKAAGDTSLLVWDPKGNRQSFLIHVSPDQKLLHTIQSQLHEEVGDNVTATIEGAAVFLRGTVQNAIYADRAAAIAAAVPNSKVVNLLHVQVPQADPQILLRVRFADYDRSLAKQFGFNLFSADQKGLSNTTTGQYGTPPTFGSGQVTFSDLLNIFYFRPDLNLGAFIRDLASNNIVQILAEPNLLAMSGHEASFLAGGEFPFPTVQNGANGVGQITIIFKEFGIRLNFVPTVTPRGTIHLTVMPEVSALDYSNGLSLSGFTVPGLSTKRVTTDIELQNGQSFAIAGLLDNRISETLDKMPGIGDVPILGKLFNSKSVTKSKTELIVIVTPEIVSALPAGSKLPTVAFPEQFMPGKLAPELGNLPTGTNPAAKTTLTIEELKAIMQADATASQTNLNVSGATGAGNGPSSYK